jgi:DNA-damage-inducible protein J
MRKGVLPVATASITIRMDEELKRQAETLFDEIGMNMTTAFTVFAKAAVRQQRIPFELAAEPFFSEKNLAELRRRAADMEAGRHSAAHELIEFANEKDLA